MTTDKLLATQGYVVGVEISGSGSHLSVALADLNGTLLYRVRHPLEYVPDSETVLRLVDDMFAEVAAPGRLQDGRVLRVGVAVGGLVDPIHGVVHTLHHAHGWDNFPLQEYLEEKLDVPCTRCIVCGTRTRYRRWHGPGWQDLSWRDMPCR